MSEVCKLVGHLDERTEGRCTHCGLEVQQWLRVEVSEGRAYTYQSFEVHPLARGDRVRIPGNVVKGPSVGTVLRVVDGPDAGYAGPYKAILGPA